MEYLAEHGGEATTEIVATNQERVIAHPRIVELLYMNKRVRMSTVNRLIELMVRHGIELTGIAAYKEIAQAIQGELIVDEPTQEALPEDQQFWATDAIAQNIEALNDETYLEDEAGQEQLDERRKPLFERISEMSMSEKVRAATLGTRDERMMLVREQNKVVARAAAKSPLLKEGDVRQIARNRSVVEDVLRHIGTTQEWLKSYMVKKLLVENPKTPIAIAASLVVQLRESDLRRITKNKNVSTAIQMAAKRHLQRRKK